MILTLTIIQIVISVILVIAVLMQHGKQQGLSGAIAGGAETFFGKNKGKTIDAILKKVTAVVALLFVASSLTLAAVSVNEYNKQNATVDMGATDASGYTVDENGNIVDAEGNIIPVEQTEVPVAEGAEVTTETTEDAAAQGTEATESTEATADAEATENTEATADAE